MSLTVFQFYFVTLLDKNYFKKIKEKKNAKDWKEYEEKEGKTLKSKQI